MTNKQELNEQELNEVSGGRGYFEYLNTYTNEIDKYETANHIGEEVLIYGYNGWVVGTLLKSYEKSVECGTRRTATVLVFDSNGSYKIGSQEDVCLDGCSIYVK